MSEQQPTFLYLSTTGRKSGLLREIEIWFTRHGGCFYVIAEHNSSQWVQNIAANPKVKVRIREETFSGSARILDPTTEPELNATVQGLSRTKYGWGEGLVVEIRRE